MSSVHTTVLRLQSVVFASSFADGMPSEKYDGVPIVEMVGDDPEGFSGLLNCI